MNPVEIIDRKRLGLALTREEIEFFVKGSISGAFAEYQTSALLMAICINGMNDEETAGLTMAMAHSGDILDLDAIPGMKVDKHSTGGVGDTTTFILAPLVAACGVHVVKMSGRGLGHTGGTIDKLEAVPGVNPSLSLEVFLKTAREVGCVIGSQTGALAPADQKLYALRDVTATVSSLPLIASSILSKKIAAGCDGIVLDVKYGDGALLPDEKQALSLARLMARIGRLSGRRITALVTDMDQPLGRYVGNALEVKEGIDVLAGRSKGPLLEVSLALGAQMLISAGRARTREEALSLLKQKLDLGEGLQVFSRLLRALGDVHDVAHHPEHLPRAARQIPIPAGHGGYACKIHTHDIGVAAGLLGAGRARKEDAIDPAVGMVLHKRLGDKVEAGEALCTLHVNREENLARVVRMVENGIEIGDRPPAPKPLIRAMITSQDDQFHFEGLERTEHP